MSERVRERYYIDGSTVRKVRHVPEVTERPRRNPARTPQRAPQRKADSEEQRILFLAPHFLNLKTLMKMAE